MQAQAPQEQAQVLAIEELAESPENDDAQVWDGYWPPPWLEIHSMTQFSEHAETFVLV